MKIIFAFCVLLSALFLLFIIFFVVPVYAQGQPESHSLGDQLARALGLSRDQLIDWIKWIGIAVTGLICYKGGAFNLGSKKTNKDNDDKK